MKGQFFQFNEEWFVVLSDAMMHPEGDIHVVAKRCTDDYLDVFDVTSIGNLHKNNPTYGRP